MNTVEMMLNNVNTELVYKGDEIMNLFHDWLNHYNNYKH